MALKRHSLSGLNLAAENNILMNIHEDVIEVMLATRHLQV